MPTRIPFSADEVVKSLERATRNWSHVPPLTRGDLEDVAEEMARLVEKITMDGKVATMDAKAIPQASLGWQLEADDGVIVLRSGGRSITVCAETVTVFDLDGGMPARKVPLSALAAEVFPSPVSQMMGSAPSPIDAYKAENAKHGWTGRQFEMQGAHLSLDRNGNAMILFKEEDLQYDESGPYIALAASEMVEFRDYLSDAFPPSSIPEGDTARAPLSGPSSAGTFGDKTR